MIRLNGEASGRHSRDFATDQRTGLDGFTITYGNAGVQALVAELAGTSTVALAEQIKSLTPALDSPLAPFLGRRFILAADELARRALGREVAP